MSRNAARARSRRSCLAVPAGLLVTLFTLACGDSTEPRRAVALGMVTQPQSSAQSGVALTQTPVVELRDQDGAPFAQAGVTVTVSIANGGGTLGGTTTQTTDAQGRASFPDLVISGTVGPRTLRFAADGLTAATSSSITLAAGPAATLEAASGVTLQATVGTAVTTRPSVVVKDASGNGVPGVSVTFAGTSGGGELTGTTQTTNSSGIATLGGWTLPTTAGQYTVSATAEGVTGSPVTFTATANPDVPTTMQPSGGGQSALYAGRLGTPLQVRVVDKYGNPTPGVVVTWGSFTGAGAVEPINVATDANGIVRSNYRLGIAPGENIIRASINPLGLSVDFSATALGFTNQLGVAISHSCALDEAGVAHCWGSNEAGQIGDGSTTSRTAPTPVGGALRFRRISVGQAVTCALTTDNVPYCWGSNSHGALGDGTATDRSVPTAVSGGHRFTEITTSGTVTCGLTAAGAAYCWGSNGAGQLGNGSAPVETCTPSGESNGFPCSRVPVPVAGSLSFASITAGAFHVCALTTVASDLYCWGAATAWGGIPSPGGGPTRAHPSFTFSAVTAGHNYTCGIVASSSAHCWGDGTFGVLGNGSTEPKDTPTPVASVVTLVLIDAGQMGTCAVRTDGLATCWGYNQTGGVGDGTTTDRTTPSTVASGQSFTAISASGHHACGRIANGHVHCWGNNAQGQLGAGAGPNRLTPVLARP
jgi:alpha-tubulin suppressor-like RCC1 family protein